MSPLVSYELKDSIAKIVFDDGKVNVMSTAMLAALHEAFERAEKDKAIVILTSGRPALFTAGFDVKIIAQNDAAKTYEMVKSGGDLAVRVLSYPYPVVTACPGHAFPMGAFLLLASDVRIGADGPFRIGFNEVAINIPVPLFGLELGRNRLASAYLQRTALTGEMYAPQEAMTAGFLDRVVAPEDLQSTAQTIAESLTKIDLPSHSSTKARLRRSAIATVRDAIASEITVETYERTAASRAAATSAV